MCKSSRDTFLFLAHFAQVAGMPTDLRRYFSNSDSRNAPPTRSSTQTPTRLGALIAKAPSTKPPGAIDTDSLSTLSVSKPTPRKRAGTKGKERISDDESIAVLEDEVRMTGKTPPSKRPREDGSGSRSSLRDGPRPVKPMESCGISNGTKDKQGISGTNPSTSNKRQSAGGTGSALVSKMGPWTKRPGERAICTEEGYDPLELVEDANREIFGNQSFRGVQKEVSERVGLMTPTVFPDASIINHVGHQDLASEMFMIKRALYFPPSSPSPFYGMSPPGSGWFTMVMNISQ